MAKNTYVLVHGAWHGGWRWSRLAPLLQAQGHTVFAPTLTGLGDRAHLARADVDLDHHIKDIVMTLEAEDLSDVTVVGHSYAGFVITGVADRAKARLRNLVYLDAFVPEDGKGLADYIPAERQASFLKPAAAQGSFSPFPTAAFGVVDAKDSAWVTAHLVNQPFYTMVRPLRLTHPSGNGLPRAYIYCSQPAMGAFDHFAAAIRNDPSWIFREMKCGHDAMVIDPAGLARVLTEFA